MIWSAAGTKLCDWCKSSSALVFCGLDAAFLCARCDEGAHHGENKHGRVWMCGACEQTAAVVTCKADSAALCVTCDREIHSANPLARRHDRVPIVPFFESIDSVLNSSSSLLGDTIDLPTDGNNKTMEEAEAASWILPNASGFCSHKFADVTPDDDVRFSDLLFGNTAPFLDFDYSMATSLADSVVPVQTTPIGHSNHRLSEHNCYELDFSKSKLAAYNDSAQSLSQSVSSDVGVVPENTSVSVSEVSYPFGRQLKVDPNSSAASQATQLSASEREARVLRYREKRKNRKFEKTIRYASRKAYAETRPRIKGRFAKRAEMETEVDDDACFYSSAASAAAFEFSDAGYGVVPSF